MHGGSRALVHVPIWEHPAMMPGTGSAQHREHDAIVRGSPHGDEVQSALAVANTMTDRPRPRSS